MSEDDLAASSVGASTWAHPQELESAASRAARWNSGQLIYYVPGWRDSPWRAMSDEAQEALFEGGRPVLMVNPHPTAEGMVRVDDGRTDFAASVFDLAGVEKEEIGPLGHIFTHAAASPSPRCAAPPMDSTP